ncbi:exodeoxyribonuclease V subunit alpha [Methylophaga sp. OBS3]|uniref:exodeoxyribonuclease V subunit alpha n=1 Tax=Methylophaga sp. OBS3 TaxID=2991934 RepID=UPI00224D4F50|nr:exodeoxyribonuclease V subunit alpha [Methylophaga sp. OBS3]MCX4188810.1 exodeoxyribonuclease V subunit alpha [Methylophaga sp. OBS3]
MSALNLLKQQGFSTLACQFAEYISRQNNRDDALLVLTAGLLSESVSDGHVCLNLLAEQPWPSEILQQLPDAATWQKQLADTEVVGKPAEFKPLILTDDGRLYLNRYWQDEQHVASAIRQRALPLVDSPDETILKSFFSEWQQAVPGVDWQKVAVLSALTQQLTVISGGPGTGKTTVVLKLLQALNLSAPNLRIALAAPTGKAAARLATVVSETSEIITAKTLHRLLGISQRQPDGRFNADNPLPLDVLIIDEASMIDISLMALTLNALPVHARLILLGDADQLASVESGAVLASLCQQSPSFTNNFLQLAKQAADLNISDETGGSPLENCLVKLQHSYRFAAESHIGQLAAAVRDGQAEVAMTLLQQTNGTLLPADTAQIEQTLMNGYQEFISAVDADQSAVAVLEAFEKFRLLAAMKNGPNSVAAVNHLMQALLARRGWRTGQQFYHGRPILITQNHYRLNLFNGDTGVVLRHPDGSLQACFMFAGELRWVPLSRLPVHETVFAMTVHKSQGSEFESVALLLPEQDNALMSRELVYTALTRARQQLLLMADEQILRLAIHRQHQRESGLADAIAK